MVNLPQDGVHALLAQMARPEEITSLQLTVQDLLFVAEQASRHAEYDQGHEVKDQANTPATPAWVSSDTADILRALFDKGEGEE